ncbi:neprilysin-2-like [Haemaphysalis longicornis]
MDEQPSKPSDSAVRPEDPPSFSSDAALSQEASSPEQWASATGTAKRSRRKRKIPRKVPSPARDVGKHQVAETAQPTSSADGTLLGVDKSGHEELPLNTNPGSAPQQPRSEVSGSSLGETPPPSPGPLPAIPPVLEVSKGSQTRDPLSPDHGGSESPTDAECSPAEKRLAQTVLKGLQLPLSPGELPLSPLIEREPPIKGRRVSLHLVPTIDIISLGTGPSTPDSQDTPASDQQPAAPPTSEAGESPPAAADLQPGSGSRSGRTSADAVRHAVVYPPVLKVRSSGSPELQLAMMEHLAAVHGGDSCSPQSDDETEKESSAVNIQRASSRRSSPDLWPPSSGSNSVARTRRRSRERLSDNRNLRKTFGASDPPNAGADEHVISRRMLGSAVFASVLLVASLFLWAVVHLQGTRHAEQRLVCSTDDCLEHARNILRWLNSSSDPCYNFHDYVCGGVGAQATTSASGRESLLRSVWREARANRLARDYTRHIRAMGIAQDMLSANMTSKAARKASEALGICLGRSNENDSRQLVEFMKERKLKWPTLADPSSGVNISGVLDILLDLSINWKVSLWFDASVWHVDSRGGGSERRVVVLGEPGHVPLLRMEQVSRLQDSTYASAIREVAHFLASGDSSADDGTLKTLNDTAAVEQLRRDESALREGLLSALSSEDVYDVLVPPHQAGSLLQGLSSDDWANLLRKHTVLPNGSSIFSDGFLVLNRAQFTELSDLLNEIPPYRLLNALGWMFAYCYVWIAGSNLDDFPGSTVPTDVVSRGAEEHRSTYLLCFLAIEESFGIAYMGERFAKDFTGEERVKVASVLNATATQLIQAVEASQAISNATKVAAVDKIVDLADKGLWPPEEFRSLPLLDALYAGFPSRATVENFCNYWLKSRQALRAAFSERHYGTLMTAKLRWYAEEILYAYSLNLMSIGLAAIFPSEYLRHGALTMTYAGLGFQLSRRLIKTIDDHGRAVDRYTGKAMNWWEERLQCRIAKLHTPKEKKLLGDLFALDLAVAAMANVSAVNSGPLRLTYLEKWTPLRTFYVSYCSHFCEQLGARDMCQLAMKGSEFGNAFDCQWRQSDRGCIYV